METATAHRDDAPEPQPPDAMHEAHPSAVTFARGAIPPVSTAVADTRPTASELAYSTTDAPLAIEPGTIAFAETRVGAMARTSVAVRNTDAREHALDPAIALRSDPFHDFVIEQTSTRMLAPGESHRLDIQFHPSRAAEGRQIFRFGTDGGTGPSGELQVSGSGLDQAGTDARIADQKYQHDEIDARVVDPLRRPRKSAEGAVSAWAEDALAYERAYADWMRSNWESFLGKTGGDVHFDASTARKIVAKVLATAASKAMEVELEGPPVGTFAVNKAIETFNDWLFEKLLLPEASPEESALQATERVSDESNAKGSEITAARDRAKQAIEDTESGAMLRIVQAADADELARWRRWGDAERARVPHEKNAKDRRLADELLAEWVQQRAATPTRSANDTNTTAWNNARTELAYRGALPTLERPDLFVHQCTREWARIGMGESEIDAAIEKVNRELRAIEVEARAAQLGSGDTASLIVKRFGAAVRFSKSVDPERTSRAFVSLAGLYSSEHAQREDLSKPFGLDCRLQLHNDGAGVYVGAFVYDLSSVAVTAHSEVRTP